MSQRLVFLSDNYIWLRGVTDATTGDEVTDATVEVTLTDLKIGTEVEGETWPLAMPHISGGDYRATLTSALEVAKGRALRASVVAVSGDVTRTFREILWMRGSV